MKRFICIFILIISLLFLYAKYVEPTLLTTHEYLIKDHNLPKSFNGFKIVQFSDILYNSEKDFNLINKTIEQIQKQNADIVVFTGDLVKKNINQKEKENLIEVLTKITPNLYKYAILGDQDTNEVKEILEKSKFIILDNTSKYIFNKAEEPLVITGGNKITDETLLKDKNINYNFNLALIHKPDDYDNIKDNFNLVLAGHSLGGEIRLPFYGALIKKSGAKKYTDKFYNYENSNLYISSGIGTEKTGLRFLNKPSINVDRLYNK